MFSQAAYDVAWADFWEAQRIQLLNFSRPIYHPQDRFANQGNLRLLLVGNPVHCQDPNQPRPSLLNVDKEETQVRPHGGATNPRSCSQIHQLHSF